MYRKLLCILVGAILTLPVFAEEGDTVVNRYPGYLTINMMSQDITTDKPDTIRVTNYKDGTALFELPNFSLDLGDGAVPLGDIVVPDCKYTVADGVTTYTGEVKNMSLAGGEIKADVTLNGTIDAYGDVAMNIAVVWMNIPIKVTFSTYKGSETVYHGHLTVNMMGSDIVKDQAAAVIIDKKSDDVANLRLPNFAIDLGDGPVVLGDIVVDSCTVATDAEGVSTIKGHVADMSLAGGEIHAEVTVEGTTKADGSADFKIAVVWSGIPINVTFTAGAKSGIADIAADTDAAAPVEYYNLQGQRLANPAAGTLVIRRQGRTASKVVL